MEALKPYNYKQIGFSTFLVLLNGDIFLTIENTNEGHVSKTVGYLNGAFMEGVIYGQFNKLDNSYSPSQQDCIDFAIWLRENDTPENAEEFFNYTNDDMFKYWVENIKKN